jgi:hypothetical protein
MSGPAFGVPLYEMPDNSWCTSLIGGQKHELPLVVFTVIEEIYRRGESHPLPLELPMADNQECRNQESFDSQETVPGFPTLPKSSTCRPSTVTHYQ